MLVVHNLLCLYIPPTHACLCMCSTSSAYALTYVVCIVHTYTYVCIIMYFYAVHMYYILYTCSTYVLHTVYM